MTKYYRVRSQEQWDWLMEHLELEYPFSSTTFLTDSIFMDLKDDQQLVPKISIKSSNINKIIEVSKLMEDEKMKYVTIKGEGLLKIKNEDNRIAFSADYSGYLGSDGGFKKLLIPKSLLYPKVRMSVAEKKEFDELKTQGNTLYTALDNMSCDGDLYIRFFGTTDLNAKQIEFARAWADPSLIEVIPEKRWNVKVPPFSRTNQYYYKAGMELDWACSNYNDHEDQQFTESELKEYGLDDDMFEKVEVQE